MIRNINNRIFTVRPTDFGRIEAIGFDLDYTLVEYNREYENLIYNLTVDTLIKKYGYPNDIKSKLKYDCSLGRKGLFIDKESGHVLSINEFGFIEVVMHGLIIISKKEDLEKIYPDRCIKVDDLINSGQGDEEKPNLRYYLISTSFATPLVCLYSQLVDFFERRQAIADPLFSGDLSDKDESCTEYMTRLIYSPNQAGITHVGQLSYANLYHDVSKAMGSIHAPNGPLKTETSKNPEMYCTKNDKLGPMLAGLRKSGKVVFLITNSDYIYTNNMLTYLLGKDWRNIYFDYVIVDANKPSFFKTKTADFRIVEKKTGHKLLGSCGSKFIPGMVYAGGNIELFHKFVESKSGTRIKQKATAYVGDHIMGDIAMVRTDNFWRTCLIIPEAAQEAIIMQKNEAEYKRIENLEYERMCLTAKLTLADIDKPPRLEEIQNEIAEISTSLNFKYNKIFGSMFSTWSHSWLGAQIQSSCDLYTSSACNFLYYPSYYTFSINNSNRFLPHQKNPRQVIPSQSGLPISGKITVEDKPLSSPVFSYNTSYSTQQIKQLADIRENEIATSCDLNVASPVSPKN